MLELQYMSKVIDISSWARKKSYEWFSSFSNPTYGVTSRLDVTALVRYVKSNGLSFFENMLYLTTLGINSVPQLRLRVEGGNVVLHDYADPSFTVALNDGLFDLCRVPWQQDPRAFCRTVRQGIEGVKSGRVSKNFGDENLAVLYLTCLPWIDFTDMSNPIPDDPSLASIPRICWGQYVREGENFKIALNITVSHALVDGKPLCDAFAAVQKNLNDCIKLLMGGNNE